MRIMLTILTILSLTIVVYAQDEELPSSSSMTGKLSIGANAGLTEPWNTAGIGAGAGFKLNIFGQYYLN